MEEQIKRNEINNMNSRNENDKDDCEQKRRKYKPCRAVLFKHDLQDAWLEFISPYDFDIFATLTFREDIEPWKAEKRFNKWIGSLNCYLFGWRYKRKGLGIRYVVGIEYQKRGTLHLHALLGAEGLKEINRDYIAKLWKNNGQRYKKTGKLVDRIVNGHAVIEDYDPSRGAKHYMTKYVHKGGQVDIFVPRKERDGQVP